MRISPLSRSPFPDRKALKTVAAMATLAAACFVACSAPCCFAAPPANPSPDVLVLKNGDTLHGKLVNEIHGTITFHSEALGDLKVKWSDVKELHTTEKFAVLNKAVKMRSRKAARSIPVGTLDVEHQALTVHQENATTPPISTGDAAYVVNQATLNQQAFHQPNFFTGWNGALTAGATVVEATQNQYTASGSVGLVRMVPGVAWLNPRNRTSADFSGSFGRITEPGAPAVKTAIFHADAERDEYFSSRFFGLGQAAFDHNFSQGLALQSVYGGGIGFTAIMNTHRQLDVKATIQYESQQFLATPPAPASPTQDLIGSTFSANYALKLKLFTFTQELAFIPAYNTPHDYSANETDTVAFPAYKNFSFSVGTLDSYLNDPPLTTPPTKPNSFQFTLGLTYNIKSKY